MSTPPTAAGSGPPRRGWYALFGVVILLATVMLVMVAFRAESSTDFRDFWENALQFRETGEIAHDEGVHNYLPFFTIFMTPWSFLPLPVAAVSFVLLSLALFGLSAYMTDVLLSDGVPPRPRAALLVSLGLALPYVYACAVVGNLGLLLLFLVVATWFLVERGREWEAGLALGLATLIKLLPAVLIVFFLFKRRWRVAGTAAAVTVVLGLGLPLATLGYARTVAEHNIFYEGAVKKHSAYQTITADRPVKAQYNNNALPIVLRRLLSPVNVGSSDEERDRLLVNIADWPRGSILDLYVVLIAGLVVASVVTTLRGPQRWPPEDMDGLRRLRGQFGVWCCLMLLASPLVWTHYLPLVYWPLAVLADRVERTGRAARRPWRLGVTAVLVWMLAAVLLAWPAARAAGAQLASVACLWLAMTVPERQARPPSLSGSGQGEG